MRNSKDRRAEKKLLKELEQLTSKLGELKGKIISAYEGWKRCAKAGYDTGYDSVHLVSLDYAKWMPHHICKDLALKVLKCMYIFHPNSPKGFIFVDNSLKSLEKKLIRVTKTKCPRTKLKLTHAKMKNSVIKAVDKTLVAMLKKADASESDDDSGSENSDTMSESSSTSASSKSSSSSSSSDSKKKDGKQRSGRTGLRLLRAQEGRAAAAASAAEICRCTHGHEARTRRCTAMPSAGAYGFRAALALSDFHPGMGDF
jgi:hypothetical protein